MNPFNTDFDTEVKFETEANALPEDPPFHILFFGDFSGRQSRPDAGAPKRRPVFVDRDNFDGVIERLGTGLALDIGGDGGGIVELRFKELEDFHPDRIYRQVPLFADLRDVRKRLLNDETFEKAAGEVRAWFGDPTARAEAEENGEPAETVENEEEAAAPPAAGGGDLLDQILDQGGGDPGGPAGASSPKRQPARSSELSQLVSKLVRPHLIQTDEQEQARLLEIVDEATGELMRSILHHPQFQALEAAWRGLYLVVRRLETGTDLKLFLLDISKPELAEKLKSVSDLSDSMIYDVVVRDTAETLGGEPWALLCGNFDFSLNIDDTATLMRLAQIADRANAPFIAHVRPDMFGITSFAATPDYREWKLSEEAEEARLWNALRAAPEARSLGLALPRFLARLPYGEDSDPVETFSFEELGSDGKHEEFLWANTAFICALLLGQSYRSHGWELGSRLYRDIDGLPIYMHEEDGETRTKPCAEVVMTETGANKILEEGLMPLLSFRNTDRVHLARFQSVAAPAAPLKSRWN